jgi:hypothetical protein
VGKRLAWRQLTAPDSSPELEVLQTEIRRVQTLISTYQFFLQELRKREHEELALIQDADDEGEEEDE